MIDIASTTAPKHHPFLPLAARQCRCRSLDEAPRTAHEHQHAAEPDLDAAGKRALATFHPSKSPSIAVPTARKRTLALLKTP